MTRQPLMYSNIIRKTFFQGLDLLHRWSFVSGLMKLERDRHRGITKGSLVFQILHSKNDNICVNVIPRK